MATYEADVLKSLGYGKDSVQIAASLRVMTFNVSETELKRVESKLRLLPFAMLLQHSAKKGNKRVHQKVVPSGQQRDCQ